VKRHDLPEGRAGGVGRDGGVNDRGHAEQTPGRSRENMRSRRQMETWYSRSGGGRYACPRYGTREAVRGGFTQGRHGEWRGQVMASGQQGKFVEPTPAFHVMQTGACAGVDGSRMRIAILVTARAARYGRRFDRQRKRNAAGDYAESPPPCRAPHAK